MNTCTLEKIYSKRRRRSGIRFEPEPLPRPKSKAKMLWIIAISEDGYEHCLTGKKNWITQKELQFDTNGKPMRVLKEFEAESYEEARAIYEAQL
jgi:hypothetical protein